MRLLRTLTLAAAVACLCAATCAGAQSGRAKHKEPPGVGRGGGSAEGDQAQGGGGPGKRDEDYSRVFTSREVTRKAVITRRPPPEYPRGARRYNVAGVVRLRIILRADGRVDEHIEVQVSLPYGVTEEAIKAARRIEFEPAEKDGRKVSQYALVEYNFNIY